MAIGDGLGAPLSAPVDVIDQANADAGEVLLGWVPQPVPWLDAAAAAGGRSMMAGGALEASILEGRIDYVPIRYACVPRLISSLNRLDVLVVRGRPSGSGFAFGTEVGWVHDAAQHAGEIVIEVDDGLAHIDAPQIPGSIREVRTASAPVLQQAAGSELSVEEARIGRWVAELLPKGATVQYGPGPLGRAVLEAVGRPVRIRSGLVDDAVVELAERGLLRDQIVAGYLYGSSELHELGASGQIRLAGIEETHGSASLAAIRGFVAINAALQVRLDGAVNAERIGGRRVAGVGGHADFCAAAARNAGGLSVIAAPSMRHGRSTVVVELDSVTTPAWDVDVVVTEFGVADLRGLGLHARIEALIGIAHTAVRDDLAAQAHAVLRGSTVRGGETSGRSV